MDGLSVTFNRKRWKVIFEKMKGQRGLCDSPDTRNKKIRIDPRIKKNQVLYLDTLLHEALHAACWHLDEEAVEEYATKTAEMLYKLGFRCTEDPDA